MTRIPHALVPLTLLACVAALATACDAQEERPSGGGTPVVADGERPRETMSEATREHFDRGREAAKAAIAEGNPRIQTLGLPDFGAGGMDVESGLPTENLGCEINDELDGYVSGWNAEMRRAAAAGELRGVSLAAKVTTREALERRFAEDTPTALRTGGEPVTAPGGRHRIVAAPHPTLDAEYLWVIASESGERRELAFFSGEAELLFDHDGGTLLVRDDGYGAYQTYDLASALFMQGFPDP